MIWVDQSHRCDHRGGTHLDKYPGNLVTDEMDVVSLWSILDVIRVEQIQPNRRRPQKRQSGAIFIATQFNGVGRVRLASAAAVISLVKGIGRTSHDGDHGG